MESRSWYVQEKLMHSIAAETMQHIREETPKRKLAKRSTFNGGQNRAERRALAAQQRRAAKRNKATA